MGGGGSSRAGETGGRNFFSSPSLNNINICSLNNKTTNILTLFNSIFWFRSCSRGIVKEEEEEENVQSEWPETMSKFCW